MFEWKINITKDNKVSARELYEFLGSKRQFADWIKQRINKYGFEENVDYICVSQKCETQRKNGQRGITITKDYMITLDMAKELSMIENSPKGREARRYFLDLEKYVQDTKQMDLFNNWRDKSAKEHHENHKDIDNDIKCIALDKEIYKIVSYLTNSDILLRKEQILRHESWGDVEQTKKMYELYHEIMRKTYELAKLLKTFDEEHYVADTLKKVKKTYIDDEIKYKEYITSHKTGRIYLNNAFGNYEDEFFYHK